MRVLVDTSVWSLALRRQSSGVNAEAVVLQTLIEQGEDIFLLGVILQEILQGIKNPKDVGRLKEHLAVFPLLELTRDDYIKAAELKNHLAKKGIQAGTIDALIASAAISYGCFLLTADHDFTHIATHSKLKLLSQG